MPIEAGPGYQLSAVSFRLSEKAFLLVALDLRLSVAPGLQLIDVIVAEIKLVLSNGPDSAVTELQSFTY